MTSPVIFAILHATSLCLPFSSHHFTSLHVTSLCLPFFLHHFTSLRATLLHLPSLFPASLHATSLHLLFCPSHFTPPHATLFRLPFCLPHFTPLYATSHRLLLFLPDFTPLHLPSFRHTSPHLTSSHLSSHPANFTIFANDSDIQKIHLQKIQIFERFALANLLNICHICKRFLHSKDSTQIFCRIFRMF